MLCFMCSRTGFLSRAAFLPENIPAAISLLKRNITPDEAEDALVCSGCQQTFLDYVELQQKLASIENAFSISRKDEVVETATAPEEQEEVLPYDTTMEQGTIHPDNDSVFDPEEFAVKESIIHTDENMIEDHVEMTEGELEQAILLSPGSIENDASEIVVSGKNFRKSSDGALKCNFCDFSIGAASDESAAIGMVEHLSTNHYINVAICDICEDEFRNAEEFEEHKSVVHPLQAPPKTTEVSCTICSLTFTNSRQLQVHTRMDHETCPKAATRLQCDHCQRKFNSTALLDDHMNSHTGERPYKCEVCAAEFSSKYIYNSHVKIHTERKRPFTCDQCGKAFLTNTSLGKHKQTHAPERNFECRVCKKAFKSLRGLHQHEAQHEAPRFNCRHCGKGFVRSTDLTDHERVHTGEKPFSCDLCSAAFAQKSNLATHKKTTHLKEEKFKCDRCPRTFKRQRLLDCHVMSKHLNSRPYKCHLCTLTYTYPDHLRKHLTSAHGPDNPHPCEFCKKTSNSKEALRNHRYIHSTKKMYECIVCEQGFMRKPLLLSHMRQANHKADTFRFNSLVAEEVTKEKGGKEWILVAERKVMDLNCEIDYKKDGVKSQRGRRSHQGNRETIKEKVDETVEVMVCVDDEKHDGSNVVLQVDDWENRDSILGYHSFMEVFNEGEEEVEEEVDNDGLESRDVEETIRDQNVSPVVVNVSNERSRRK